MGLFRFAGGMTLHLHTYSLTLRFYSQGIVTLPNVRRAERGGAARMGSSERPRGWARPTLDYAIRRRGRRDRPGLLARVALRLRGGRPGGRRGHHRRRPATGPRRLAPALAVGVMRSDASIVTDCLHALRQMGCRLHWDQDADSWDIRLPDGEWRYLAGWRLRLLCLRRVA